MSPNSEFKSLRNHLNKNLFMSVSIKDAITFLSSKGKTIRDKKSRTTDEEINHMLTMSSIEECNLILKEMQ